MFYRGELPMPQIAKDDPWRVAVLVPRVDIAREQAAYVGKLRSWTVGNEVGYAVASDVLYDVSGKTTLVFMTYGFFYERLMAQGDNLKEWVAIIFDETHERQTKADALISKVGQIQGEKIRKQQNPPKAVLLSATMETKPFTKVFQDANVESQPLDFSNEINCPFPVSVEYRPLVNLSEDDLGGDGLFLNPNDKEKKGKSQEKKQEEINSISKQLYDILQDHFTMYEDTTNSPQNVLIFVASRDMVYQLASKLADAKFKNRDAQVLQLHGGLDPIRRSEVLSLASERDSPKIIICTNIAESGLTVQNVSLVIDFGKRMVHSYNPKLHLQEKSEEWISQASAHQRKGRAGRMCPGRCIRLYTESNLNEEMPDYDSPRIFNDNISRELLRHLLNNNYDPRTFAANIPEPPTEQRIQESMEALKDLRLLDPGNKQLAENISKLSIDLRWACCIMTAYQPGLECPLDLIKIACLVESWDYKYSDEFQEYGKRAESDLEVMLAVYEAWEVVEENGDVWDKPEVIRSLESCFHMVRQRVTKIAKYLNQLGYATEPTKIQAGKSERIRRCLCSGFFFCTAIPTKTDERRLQPVDPRYKSLDVRYSSYSAVDIKALGENKLVLFTSGVKTKQSSVVTVMNLAVVEQNWVEEVSGSWWQNLDAARQVRDLRPQTVSVEFPKEAHKNLFRKRIIPSIQGNFQSTQIDLQDSAVIIIAPAQRIQEVERYVKSRITDVTLDNREVEVGPERAKAFTNDAEADLENQMKELLEKMGINQQEIPLKFSARVVKNHTTIKLQCCRMFLHNFERMLRSYLGIPIVIRPPGGGPQEQLSGTDLQGLVAKNPRLKTLFDAGLDSVKIFNMAEIGDVQDRIYLALAHFITHHTRLFIFGGFIRDFLVRSEKHPQLDLDVGFDEEFGKIPGMGSPLSTKQADTEWQRIVDWAKANLNIGLVTRSNKGNNVSEYRMDTKNGGDYVVVELVNVSFFRNKHGLPDADVNSLRLLPDPQNPHSAIFAHKFPDGDVRGSMSKILRPDEKMSSICGTINEIIRGILAKKLRVLNTVSFDANRRKKFTDRNWTIVDS